MKMSKPTLLEMISFINTYKGNCPGALLFDPNYFEAVCHDLSNHYGPQQFRNYTNGIKEKLEPAKVQPQGKTYEVIIETGGYWLGDNGRTTAIWPKGFAIGFVKSGDSYSRSEIACNVHQFNALCQKLSDTAGKQKYHEYLLSDKTLLTTNNSDYSFYAEKDKAIVDAVNYYHVDIEFYSDRDDHPIIEGAIYKARQTGYFLSTIDEPDHEFVCTIEEFNQCVKDMSEFAGAAEYGQYLAHIDIFGIEKLEPVKPRTTPFLQTGEDFEHTKTLNFIRDRMINVHGENSHYDYMHKLNNAIIFMEKTEVYTDVGAKESAKPRTSIEYVKVDGLFWNIAKEYKENKESIFHKSGENYFLIKTLESLVKSHKARNVYRKVETEITWQDAVADYLSKCKYLINNSGCIELDLNSCSTSTELLDEGGKEFIEMCHLVTSMTK